MTMIVREPNVFNGVIARSAMIAGPVALFYVGGPLAVWNYSGLLIRSIVVITAVPTLIEGLKVVKGTIKVVARVFMILLGKKSEDETTNAQKLWIEVRGTAGSTRHLLLPSISVTESFPVRVISLAYRVMAATARSIGWVISSAIPK